MFHDFLRRTGFRRQLTVIVSAAIVGLALFSSLMNSWEARTRMREYFLEQGERIAENLARQSTLALLYHSPENAQDVVATTLTFPDVLSVQITDTRGVALLSKSQPGAAPAAAADFKPVPPTTQARLASETGQAWRFTAPVFGGQGIASPFDLQEPPKQLLGHVHVAIAKDTLSRLTLSLLVGNLVVTLSFAAILLAVVRLLTRHMINPLNALSRLMRRAEAGESGMRAEPAGPRDLIDMALAFNKMMNVLEQREAELKDSRDAAVSMALMKAQFAATVSHEVRTPLNGVVGMLDMLKEMSLNKRQAECVDVAWNSSRTLIELINNILDFSKMEAGKLSLEEVDFDLRKLLEEVIELVAKQAQVRDVELAYLLAPGVPQCVNGDSLRLRQVLINLLGNAVKFTEHGEVAVSIALADGPLNAPHCGLRFEVRDTGIGMSADQQEHLFQSFAQADPSTTRKYGGTGLGLAICKQLVELMGGAITVDSALGDGTAFAFNIVCKAALRELPEPAHLELAGLRVIVVDDSQIVRSFVAQTMQRHGIDCHGTRWGGEALLQLKVGAGEARPYSIVMMDIDALDDDGNDLAGRIAAESPGTLVLILDRFGTPSGGTLVDGHPSLGKPLREERLLQALKDLLAGAKAPAMAIASALAAPPRTSFRILVAEDNRTNQMVAAGMLAMNGCACEFAANGREALEAARSGNFDLILMDCSMPEMDGYEATAHIRAFEHGSGRRTPLVAMTANTQRGDAEKCLAAGMDDYLAKPITLFELRQKLDRWLPRGEESRSAMRGGDNGDSAKYAPETGDSPIDQAMFVKLREIMGPSLAQAISPFLEDTPHYLLDLETAAHGGDFDTARAKAHAIKGSSGNLGATHLAQLAKEAEEHAIAGRPELIVPLLPRLRVAYNAVAGALALEVTGDGPAGQGGADDVPQVLIVDDDRSTRSTLRYTLQRDGFKVEEAVDGAQALTMLKRFQPDVVLMDAVMPVMDGFTACARMQELPGGSSIPVLMITALEDNSSVERAFAAGASDYIPKPIHYAVLSQRVRRVIEANRAEKRIRHLAFNDLLTGLPNRTLFFDLLGQAVDQARVGKTQLAVLFLDLDRFKYVNDNLGHDVGDRLLVAVAQRIRRAVRSIDMVARLGGDEFTVVLGDVDGPAPAAAAAQAIGRVLAAPFQIDGHDIFVTSSVGIAMYPFDGLDVPTLVKRADSAMYRAKKTNTGFQFYEASMEQAISEHVRLESDLRRALERNELEVFYQPQARLDNQRIIGMEALVRWKHPTRGMVPPVEFIPLAEETGLINPLGQFVLRTACAQLKAWIDQGLPPMRVAVNLSVRQLLQKNFADTVEAVLIESSLPPDLLELEITESTLMEHAQDTLKALHRLRGLGVRLSIDDFGTGYSSLSYLKRFPVDIIKIDRSFVADVPHDADDAAIIAGIIALAHSLRLEVVAEGVETQAQLDYLRAQHCDLLQGWYLAPAMPADQFAEMIIKRESMVLRA
ncbi:EAL domain-containing protein [Massilia sp. CCM 8734]|uniref:EAL domain-containing protein n=1 Tax=Massilia sp. CCM 8734 TaxID=2609283 RepID=UPI00141DF76A|nr:EAL domain-containing protein [Massilia sp. CCM 8734]NHZ94643.1 EAL domain-containing protein [Massilia sp. CCM 8734]